MVFPSHRVRTVLLADGSDTELLLVQSVLDAVAPDTEVDAVSDGVTVLQRLQAGPVPDLVLLALNLPLLSGLEVYDALRSHAPDARVEVWSTTWSPADQAQARELGVTHCWQKPTTYDELEVFLSRLLSPP